jgi:DNA-binding transcriptional ArsR family regulator
MMCIIMYLYLTAIKDSNMQRWELIFKSLANINRLKIIKILSNNDRLDVGSISEKLKISFKATSQHLIILKNVGALESIGEKGRVHYLLNSDLPKDFARAIALFK